MIEFNYFLVAAATSGLDVQNQQKDSRNQHKENAGNKAQIVNLH